MSDHRASSQTYWFQSQCLIPSENLLWISASSLRSFIFYFPLSVSLSLSLSLSFYLSHTHTLSRTHNHTHTHTHISIIFFHSLSRCVNFCLSHSPGQELCKSIWSSFVWYFFFFGSQRQIFHCARCQYTSAHGFQKRLSPKKSAEQQPNLSNCWSLILRKKYSRSTFY